MNKTKIYTILPNNIKIEYTVILTCTINNNNYIVYTDNTYDKNKKLRFYAAKYNNNNQFTGEPTTKEEWNEITKVINRVIIPQ